ncbi:hypothetical protein Xcel_0510 [Xylanimonas cellulosilytica DSM 15894]|uniref:Uncharacterized protein n=1 Tax=Xylanimonas cellulosilytica (strain DSM 15894 / JCM 12276 / CECT 5975 / KCTC 9989 / LMG 20990 / NBRC 107835 / XIL07) TaxID=446471 RepID=D1BW46_XYLCX|nr:hypothetical protein [Xylanimonas cellulosilytica]ACZ29549.1 hypothetical protein Xcel_0510 [Xylanimonas cellulosilytica DSM 15894]
MPEPETHPFGHLITRQVLTPRLQERLPAPVPTRCTARSYAGRVVAVDGVVTHRAGRWLAFTADYADWGEWAAWVDRDCCEVLEDGDSGDTTR